MIIKIFSHAGATHYNVPSDSEDFPPEVLSAALNAQKWSHIRSERNKKIEETDNIYLRHHRELRNGKAPDDAQNPTALSSSQLAELDDYVQDLADIPQTYSNPDDVVWPEKPSL